MSEVIEQSGFTPQGFESMPSIYSDSRDIGNVSELANEVLDAKTMEYGRFLQSPDIMPRAKQSAERIINHLLFELAWRDGVYDGK